MSNYYNIGIDWGDVKKFGKQVGEQYFDEATKSIKEKIRKEAADASKKAVAPVAREEAAKGARQAVTPMVVAVGAVAGLALIMALRK